MYVVVHAFVYFPSRRLTSDRFLTQPFSRSMVLLKKLDVTFRFRRKLIIGTNGSFFFSLTSSIALMSAFFIFTRTQTVLGLSLTQNIL